MTPLMSYIELSSMNTDTTYAAYIGRFSPLHVGHGAVIERMFEEFGPENSLIVIGSSNTPTTLRHFFTYDERKRFIKKVYEDARIVGLPDYATDQLWLSALDDLLLVAGMDPKRVTFFGGCEEDISFFQSDGRKISIMNRFDGSTKKVSATEVRDALIHGRPLQDLVHPSILTDLLMVFAEKWETFKKM